MEKEFGGRKMNVNEREKEMSVNEMKLYEMDVNESK